MHRRTVLTTAACVASVSGCLGLGEPSEEPDDGRADGDDRTGEETDDETTGDDQTDPEQPLDARGTIAIVIDDEPVNLDRDRFQADAADENVRAFHLHEGSSGWYMEGQERPTFAEGLDLLPNVSHERDASEHRLVVDGEEYDERAAGVSIDFRVDGDAVDPTAYGIRDGDELVVEVSTGS